MRTTWQENGKDKEVVSPVSLIVSAFAHVHDVRKSLTPQLRTDCGETVLILLDLGAGKNRLGGSAFAQVTQQIGQVVPDLDDPSLLVAFFNAIQQLNEQGKLLAYHDRSDGGLFATLCEMAFAGRCGLNIDLSTIQVVDTLDEKAQLLLFLFAEELGGV